MTQEPIVIERYVEPSCPQFDIIVSRQQVNLFLAGQASGKSFIAGVVSGQLIATYPKSSGFIGANTYIQLSDSTLKRIRTVWKEFFGWTEWSKDNPKGCYVVDIQPPSHFNTEGHDFDTYRGKICFLAGTIVFKGSLDNYKAHDGKEFGWAILDETKDTKEEAVKEVITGRLREIGMYVDSYGDLVHSEQNEETGEQHTPWNPLFIFTSPAKVQWINEWFNLDDYVTEITEKIYSDETYFIKDIDNKRVVICSTFHNAKNLPSNYIANQLKNLSPGLRDMLIYGNPFSSAGGEFYKAFLRATHVQDVRLIPEFNHKISGRAYNPDIALHVSFDFNSAPYMTCTIYQIIGKKIYQIDEICLSNPLNKTEHVCKEFIRRYRGHAAGLSIYGDPSGKNEDTRTEKGSNDFTIIQRALGEFHPTMRVLTKHPPVAIRGDFINSILENQYDGLEIIIHITCVKSISDFVYLKEAADRTKLKEKIKDPNTGITYEKYGHCMAGDTMVETISGRKRIDCVCPGDFVLTRYGYREVLNVWDNGVKEVKNYLMNKNSSLTCTPNHNVWTIDGFREINKICYPRLLCITKEGKISKEHFKAIPQWTGMMQVYDLTVEGFHEYFANGVLVHNCSDSFDYMICFAFASEFARYQRGGIPDKLSSGRNAGSKNSY